MSSSSAVETLPHADEAERALLGAILIDASQFDKARELVSDVAFYLAETPEDFQRARVHDRGPGSAPDIVLLKDELERRQELAECGGPAYLASLMDGIPRSAHVEHYARVVREKSILRDLIRTTQSILSSAIHPTVSTDELVDEAEKAIFQVSENRLGSGFLPIRVSAEQSLKWIEELTERQELNHRSGDRLSATR